jgi:hypothetical protein
MRAIASVCLGVLSLFAALAAGGAPPPSTTCQACAPCQSPRDVTQGRHTSDSLVVSVSTDQKQVWIRGRQAPLVFCGQHYHAPVENVQGCRGETALISAPPQDGSGRAPDPGQWIEVHTVYAPEVKPNCQAWQSLDCCGGVSTQDPALVRGFSARVVASRAGTPAPGQPTTPGQPILIPTPSQGPLAEWLGSNTGPDSSDKPGECKPTPAWWSFRLTSCDSPFTVNQAALDASFGCHQQAGAKSGKCGWQGARELQAGPRVSSDLWRVP